jgi:hypothetical protein
MVPENEKYKQVLQVLRNSKPVLESTEEIEKEVLKRISKVPRSYVSPDDVIDFLFGWVYIGWVRRSLITASVLLVITFTYQQRIILQRLDVLSRQTIITDGESEFIPSDDLEKSLTLYKLSGKTFTSRKITLSEQQVKQMLESVNEIEHKYKDLLKLIEEDPELKKYVEKKLLENNHIKTNL